LAKQKLEELVYISMKQNLFKGKHSVSSHFVESKIGDWRILKKYIVWVSAAVLWKKIMLRIFNYIF